MRKNTTGSSASSEHGGSASGTSSCVYTDKEILQDTLMSQKHITDAYNTFAGECVSAQLRSTMLNILNDEHKIQADIFSSMQSKGWYKTENATKAKIQQTKTKVTSG